MNRERVMRWGVVLALVTAMGLAGWAGAAEDTPLTKQMEAINSAYKVLQRQSRRLDFNEDSLKAIKDIQINTLAGMHEPVAIIKKAPAAEQTKLTIEYKKIMAATLMDAINLEIALLEGNKEEAKALIDKLGARKKEGHDKFVEE